LLTHQNTAAFPVLSQPPPPVYQRNPAQINKKIQAFPKTNVKHRLIKTAKDVKTVFFYIELVFFNIENMRFLLFFLS
jgi:hypothetical protein